MRTDSSTSPSSETLFSLFETKLHLLREMQAMALEQDNLVVQHDMAGLMSLLSRKQELMDSLKNVQTQLLEFQGEDPESRPWLSLDRRRECQELVKQCDRLLQGLIVQENRSIDNMNLKRDGLQSLLQQNAAASEIQRAYASSFNSDSQSISGFTLEG